MPAVLGRDSRRLGLAALVLGAAVGVTVGSLYGLDTFFQSDAAAYREIARAPFGSLHSEEAAYRYGRILSPLAAWVLALGRPSAVSWTMPVVNVLAFAGMVAFSCELCRRRGVDGRLGALVLVVPGIWICVLISFVELLMIFLVLVTYVLVLDGRHRLAWVAAAAAILSRETAVVALAPLVLDAVAGKRWKDAARWMATPVPYLLWCGWIRVAVGQWPFLADTPSRHEAISPPLGGMVAVVGEGADAVHWLTFAIALITIAACVYVGRTAPWFPVTGGALAFGLLVLVFGPNVFRFWGESLRLLAPAQVLVVLSIASVDRTPDGLARPGDAPATARR